MNTKRNAVLIQPDGSTSDAFPANGRIFQYEELRGLVGGLIQILDPLPEEPDKVMVINEEGKIMDPPMAHNATASRIWQAGATHPARLADDVVGPALLCFRTQLEGEED